MAYCVHGRHKRMKKGGTKGVNGTLLKSVIVLHGDTQGTLAKALGIPESALSNRISGRVDFRLSEINGIRKRYNLELEKTGEIFFDEVVSN